MSDTQLYDFFLSYKRKDSSEFVSSLAQALRDDGYQVWFDDFEIRPGDSLTASIERGLSNSLIIVAVLSRNYFEGWSETERRAALNLLISQKRRLVPVWHGVDAAFISNKAPLLSDLAAIVFDPDSPSGVTDTQQRLAGLLKPKEQQMRLWDFLVAGLHKRYPGDPNVALFHAVVTNDKAQLERAIADGANVNIADSAIVNYYQSAIRQLGMTDALAKWLILRQKGQEG